VGIFHSGDFAEYVSGGFVHFTPGDDSHHRRAKKVSELLGLSPQDESGEKS